MFKIKINYKSILLYLFIFAVIYQSGSVRAAVLSYGFLFYATRLVLIAAPMILILVLGIRNKQISVMVLFLFLGLFFVGINYFLYPDGAFQVLYKIVILVLTIGVYLAATKRNIEINQYIYKTIVFIATVSLVFYLATDLGKLPIPYSVVYSDYSYRYHDFFELYFSYHYNEALPRLSGLFWEPGAYQIYLNIALFLHVFERKNNKFELAILLISILFAQSTLGYCIAALLVAVHLSMAGFFNKKSKTVVGAIGLLMALIAACFIVYKKAEATSGIDGSATLRFLDIVNGLKVFSNHPLIGNGFGNEQEFKALDYFGRGSSNGLLSYAYMTGLVGLIFAFVPFVRNYIHAKDKKRQAVWIVVLLLANCGEPIYNLPIMAFYLAIEYVRMLERRHLKRVC